MFRALAFFLLLPVFAHAACTGGIGYSPFNCTVPATMGLTDIVLGGSMSGATTNDTVKFTGSQIVGLDHSASPVTANAITQPLSTWAGYLSGTINTNPVRGSDYILTGGSIDGTPIGANVPANGNFAAFTTTGTALIAGAATFQNTLNVTGLMTTNDTVASQNLVYAGGSGSGQGISPTYNRVFVSGNPADQAVMFLSIVNDTVAAAHIGLADFWLTHNFGGTGTAGPRNMMVLNLNSVGPVAASTQMGGIQTNIMISQNMGGTSYASPGSTFFGSNPTMLVTNGASYISGVNLWGEGDLAIVGANQSVTVGGTPTSGDQMQLIITDPLVTGSPLTVEYAVGTGNITQNMIAGLCSVIWQTSALSSVGDTCLIPEGSTNVFSVYWPIDHTFSMTANVTGSATETITLGTPQSGGSVDQILGMSTQHDGHTMHGHGDTGPDIAWLVGGGASVPAAGWDYIIGLTSEWPLAPTGTIIGAPYPLFGTGQQHIPLLANYGLDFQHINFSQASGDAIRSPGFLLDGFGTVTIGGTTLTSSSTGLAINANGYVGSSNPTISNGGGGGAGAQYNNYFPNDIVTDAFGGQYLVASVNNSTGAATALTTLVQPFTSGSLPSTTQAMSGGSGHNLVGTVTWVHANTLALQTSGGPTTIGGSLNLTAGPYQLYGNTILNESTATIQSALVVGFGAGASLPSNAIFSTFVGAGAGALFTGTSGEATCVGTIACPLLTTGTFDVALGEHAMGSEVTANSSTAIGNDNQRDWVSTGENTSVGKSAMQAGGGITNSALGFQALQGNSGNLTFGGTATNGDTIPMVFTGTFTGSPHTVTISITTSETTAQMATAAKNAINADTTLLNSGLTAGTASSNTSSVFLVFPGTSTTGNSIVVTATSTGAATETVAITGGFTGADIIALGELSVQGNSATTATNDIGLGKNTLNAITTGAGNFAANNGAGQNVTTGSSNFFAGTNSGNLATTISSAIGIGNGSLQSVVSGANHIALGIDSMQNFTGNYAGNNNSNIAIGNFALQSTSSASYFSVVAVGGQDGKLVATGAHDWALFGPNVGLALTTATNIAAFGPDVAGTTCATAANVLLLGTGSTTDCTSGSETNTIHIGAGAGDIISATGTGTASTSVTRIAGLVTFGGQITLASSTTGAGTSTFTNSPCSGLTTERWIPVSITGQSGTWYVPACQ